MKIIDERTLAKIHCYQEPSEYLYPNQDLINTSLEIASLGLNNNPHHIYDSTHKIEIFNAQKFLNSKFKLHKVLYRPSFLNPLAYLTLKHLPVRIAIQLNNHNGIYISPYHLPIAKIGEELTNGLLEEQIIYLDSEEFFRHNHITYHQIILPKDATNLTEGTYVHEITHTQLNDRIGAISSYFDSELLSIFLELVCLYENQGEDTLKIQDAIRTDELIKDVALLNAEENGFIQVGDNDLLQLSKYTSSIKKAYHLFLEYYYGTIPLKKYILTSIQNIFNGDLSLEDLLLEFDITFTSNENDRRLIKYLSRN